MTFIPEPQLLTELREVFIQSLSPNNAVRSQATKALEAAKQQRDLDNYLVYLLVTPGDDAEAQIRASAGLMLKNNVRNNYAQLSELTTGYIKSQIFQGLFDSTALVRNITGNVITTMVAKAGITGWPEAISQLMALAEGDNPSAQQGAMSALAKVCEDSAAQLDRDYNGERPLNYMIPKFLEFTQSPLATVRSQAVFCLTQFILLKTQALLIHIDAFLNALFALAADSDPEIKLNVCTAFVNLLEVRPDKLTPHLDGVINYCLHCMKDDSSEQLALEACEFILALSEADDIRDLVRPHLKVIIPTILSTMVYSETDLYVLDLIDEDDEDVADKAEDIKPVNAKSKNNHLASGSQSSKGPNHNDGDQFSDEEEEEDEDGLEMGLEDWNLRKCSAASLDVFSSSFPEDVFQNALPYLQEHIESPEWPNREAAILAFGAIAEGCAEVFTPHLPQLVPFLIQRLSDKYAPVRQITCWTLSRFASWICEQDKAIFEHVLEGFLKCALDKNKKVQESGCSAFATFTENAGELLAPYLLVVLQHINMCFKKYQTKNLIYLYDAVQTLVDNVGPALATQQYVELLLPPLVEKWSQLSDEDTDLWPLLECLSSVTVALGDLFIPYAQPVYERCIKILQYNIIQDQNCQMDSLNYDPPEKDFMITALDLIDGLVQGLQEKSGELIQATQPNLVDIMMVCFKDPVYEVQQSAFALLGDMAIHTVDTLRPQMSEILNVSIATMVMEDDESSSAAVNNVTWAMGELALRLGRELEPYGPHLAQRLLQLLNYKTRSPVLENAAIAIGRIGITIPELFAPYLEHFAANWCLNMTNIIDTNEKETAFQGMCNIVAQNSAGLESSLVLFVDAIGRYTQPSDSLTEIFKTVLHGYKAVVPDWNGQVMNKLDQEVRVVLAHHYGV
ncbi:ARM repeat-containing protein [Nadsonia fulvescens var. elongata DSM 6958]|uniref:ARM repeat-containing protein n=1 Tax=Nadsonia fulvescens var. elongata DSM 6958 TaxID=857566 RepID=A0A1E3PCF0_9ASCO|nr:ARM repeat-containing protein [Nadsonia fulvescens var. elongata DSM 6958]